MKTSNFKTMLFFRSLQETMHPRWLGSMIKLQLQVNFETTNFKLNELLDQWNLLITTKENIELQTEF